MFQGCPICLVIHREHAHKHRTGRTGHQMSPEYATRRCWLCNHAIWFLPIWTWTIVLLTGLTLFGLLRPDAVTGWLSLMGLILLLIGIGIAVFVDENNRDRASTKLVTASPTLPSQPRPVRKPS